MNLILLDHEKGTEIPLVASGWFPARTGTGLLLHLSMVVFLLLGSLQVLWASPARGQSINETKLTLELHGETLETALKKIEKLTPFRFVYRSEEVRQFRNISLQKAERTVDETLALLLEDTYLTF